MLHCREISKLVSDSMERDLPLWLKLQVRMHLLMCRFCAGFARQLRLLRQAAHSDPTQFGVDDPLVEAQLSEEARRRITAALRDNDQE